MVMLKKDRYQQNIDRVLKVAEDSISVILFSAIEDHGDPEYSSLVAACRVQVLDSWKLLLQYYNLWPEYFKGNVLLRAQRLRDSLADASQRYNSAREWYEREIYHVNPELPF